MKSRSPGYAVAVLHSRSSMAKRLGVSDRESVPSLGDHPWRWPVGFFLRRSGRGRVSTLKLGDFVCFGTESPGLPYAPSLTQESYRPRVSDRTMVGNSATRLACEFQRTEWRRHDREHETTGRKKHRASSLRGLQGRSATGQNDQAAKEKMSWRGWMSRKYFWLPAQGEVFFA